MGTVYEPRTRFWLIALLHGTLIEFSPINIGTAIFFALWSVHWILYYADFVFGEDFSFLVNSSVTKNKNRQVDQKKKVLTKNKIYII